MKLWNIETGECLKIFECLAYNLIVLPSLQSFLSSDGEGLIKKWNLDSVRSVNSLKGHKNIVKYIKNKKKQLIIIFYLNLF